MAKSRSESPLGVVCLINLDIVPSTVRQAAELLAESLSENEREYFRTTPASTLRGNFAGAIRQGWSLWELDTPLQRDAIRHYSIAHADDVSCLIIDWARAMVMDEEFDPIEHCKQYHAHWARLGTTSMEAAGWKRG